MSKVSGFDFSQRREEQVKQVKGIAILQSLV
jgi:hypothetical protein